MPQADPADWGDPDVVAVGVGVTVAAPMIVGMIGEVLMGVGLYANSTKLYSTGMNFYNAATTTISTAIKEATDDIADDIRPPLYRGGNPTDPNLQIRNQYKPGGKGKYDIFVDEDGYVNPHSGGLSTLEVPKSTWNDTWQYPSNAKPPKGITIVKDNNPSGHWTWEPSWRMLEREFKELIKGTKKDWLK